MATDNEVMLTWTFIQKCDPTDDITNMLVEGETIRHCYKTVRNIAALVLITRW